MSVAATERLDRFLADQLALSRTAAARLIAHGMVLINGTRARASRTLARGDRVDVTIPASAPPRELAPNDVALTIRYEDDTLLIVDKPAGLVVHPAPGHWDDTLVNALVARGTSLAPGAQGRPGIVHRLDKDTSGLLIVAKTDEAHRVLSRALSARRIERAYAALVWGHVSDPVRVDAPLARHPQDRKRMAVLQGGRQAVSYVAPVARFEVCDLVRVMLETGRTHQARVHLAHIGHPVVGDPVYGGGGARRISGSGRAMAEVIARASPRQALHAARLRLRHPVSGALIDVRSEWPPDLRAALVAASGKSSLVDRPDMLAYLGFFESRS
ncbi:MAG TPA: RluA family pseudouridine synthase [Gemmatimonadales bacterium]|nr:RluA family pseudouridine synthase [Gemmatimonadales bacterium]